MYISKHMVQGRIFSEMGLWYGTPETDYSSVSIMMWVISNKHLIHREKNSNRAFEGLYKDVLCF